MRGNGRSRPRFFWEFFEAEMFEQRGSAAKRCRRYGENRYQRFGFGVVSILQCDLSSDPFWMIAGRRGAVEFASPGSLVFWYRFFEV
jgi:hypothetical protein